MKELDELDRSSGNTEWRRFAVVALLVPIFAVGAGVILVSDASAAPLTFVDDAGADDEPGQKDLNFLTVDYEGSGATSIDVTWGWDDTDTSGANTRDACALFDTDGDGLANYSFCVIVASDGAVEKQLYSCGDGATDRCENPRSPISSTSTADASIVDDSDPFGVPGSPHFDPAHLSDSECAANPECNTDDTVADTTIQLSDLGGGSAFLLNVCSYPSGIPGSDPSDCVLEPNVGFLTIVKVAEPDDGTGFTFNSSEPATTGESSWTINGSGEQQLIPFAPLTDLDLSEVVPNGWSLDSASCELLLAAPTATGTPASTGVDDLTIQPGVVTSCTFGDTVVIGTLSIVKTAEESSYGAVGEVIHYTITVTNTGEATLAAVTVTDPRVDDLSCTPANGSSLAPGESMECTASHTVTQADIDAGHFANAACVKGAGAARVCAGEDVQAAQSPALSITKLATESVYDSVGDVIHYTITVTNTGNTTLGDLAVTDPIVSGLSCFPAPGSSLAPGESMECTASHTVTQADIDAGSFFNQACVDDGAGGLGQACDDLTTTAIQRPALSIAKLALDSAYDSVGDVIDYTVTVTNTGNTTLAAVTVMDPNASGLSCMPANGSPLAPGESMECTASHTVTQADVDAGSFFNQACADDGADGVAQACAEATTPAEQSPALSLAKTAEESSYGAVGEVIHYTISVTNTGNTTLPPVLTDPDASGLSCTPANGSSLAPDESMECTASHTVTQADIDAGHFANTACVNGGGTTPSCGGADVSAAQSASIGITKSPASQMVPSGGTAAFTITVTNTGNVTLADVTVTDAQAPGCARTSADVAGLASLAPGASVSYECTRTDVTADFTNSATATGAPPVGPDVSDTDTAAVTVGVAEVEPPPPPPPPPIALSLTKVASPDTVTLGNNLTYTIVVTNNGPIAGTGITVTDKLPVGVTFVSATPSQGTCSQGGGVITCNISTLAAGAAAAITVTVAPTATGSVVNTATVAGQPGSSTATIAATASAVVVAPLKPPAVCGSITVSPRQLRANGKRQILIARVRLDDNRPMAGARVRVTAPGVAAMRRTNARGIARIPLRLTKPGIARVAVLGARQCVTRRGIIGVFYPPVTG